MGLFYTGKGDGGESIINSITPSDYKKPEKKKILVKDSVISDALGSLDELNSLAGLVKHQNISRDFFAILEDVQETLFIVQANVADALFHLPDESSIPEDENKVPVLSKSKIENLEKVIDALELEVKPAKSFVIPGRVPTAGWLDYSRAVCRRAERNVVTFSKKYKLNPDVLAYMNRLSSLCFAMARAEVKRANLEEDFPHYE